MIAVSVTSRLSPGNVERQLLAIPNRLRNLQAFGTFALAPLLADIVKRHWETKGAAFGHTWAPWAPSTLAHRLRKGNAQLGILYDRGDLFRAAMRAAETPTVTATSAGVRVVASITPQDDPKALFHQRGAPANNLPARQVLPSPFPRSFRDPARQLLRDYVLTGQLRGAGGRFVSAAR